MSNTQKSWKGAPTVNYISNPTNEVIAGNEFAAYIDLSPIFDTYGEGYYSISADIKTAIPGSITVYTASGGVEYNIGYYSAACDTYYKRFYFNNISVTRTDPAQTVSNLSFYGGYGSGIKPSIKNVQVEKNSFCTPFVNGTRSNTQAIVDLTGTNTLTATSLTYASDGTFSFNGSNNYLTISTFVNKPTTAITVESWIRPTKPTLSGTIRGASISATNSMYLGIIDSIDGGVTHALHWANQTSSSRVTSWNGNVPNNAWSHIAGTYDGTTMRAYLNGVEIYSAAQTGTIPDATYVLGTYGGALVDGVHNFNGILPASKIYNRALSAAEVKQNFNALRGRYGI
jgi:hypothetical protein